MKLIHFVRCMLTVMMPVTTLPVFVQAQTVSTPADAFNIGKSFAHSGSNAASGTVNSDTGSNSLPHYATTAPEAINFGNGTGNVSAAGVTKMMECKNGDKANNAFSQQECDAVNFLSKNATTRQKFIIDKKTDPILTGSLDTIKNPAGDAGKDVQQCHVVNVTTPGTSTTEVCEQTVGMESITCNRTLVPQCAYTGSDITSPVTSNSGAFTLPALTAAGSRGVYNYKLEVPFKTCGRDGYAEVGFNLDTVGQGGYITINMSNLDDASAVSVNNYTVFAGYPNNGPMHSGTFFPQNKPAFQPGYTWMEQYGEKCTAKDKYGKCLASIPLYQQFTANTKLLDFCPAGYLITPQSTFSRCKNGVCSTPPSYTPSSVSGFFCNAEGKFMMNRHEGNGSWQGAINAQMPLKTGANKIQVYWGTSARGNACGNVTITGQIFNVAPSCESPWVDGCTALRAAQ